MKILAASTNKSQSRSIHITIFRGLMWVALFVLLGRLIGAGKEMAVAYRYGVSEHLDAYLFLFNIISWVASVWFSVVSYIISPLAAKLKQENYGELVTFRAELLAFSILLGCNLGLLFWFGLPLLLKWQGLGLSEQTLELARGIIPEIVSLVPLCILTNLFASWTLSSGRHSNTLLEGMPSLAILIAVLVLPQEGIKPLIWGTVAGFCLHLLTLALPLIWRGEMEWPKFSSKSSQWPNFWKGFGILLIGSALGSLVGIVDQFFAAKLSSGSIATLGYANRVIALLMSLGATAISRATLPVFSNIKTQEDQNLKKIAMFWMRLMLFLGILVAAGSWWFAPWIIQILFERGAFTAENTLLVSDLFRYGLTQVPFYFGTLVIITLLATYGKHKMMSICGVSNLVVKSAANYFLVPVLGLKAIVVSTGIMYGVTLTIVCLYATFGLKTSEVKQA